MSTDIAALVEQYPSSPANSQALLAWAQEVELKYGPWQSFKRLYKKVEAPALNAQGQLDLPLLAVLLHRIDDLSLTGEGRRPLIKPVAVGLAPLGQSVKTLRNDQFELRVGGRTTYDYNGLRFSIKPLGEPRPGFAERMLAVLRRAAPTPAQTSAATESAPPAPTQAPLQAVFDVDAREYIGYDVSPTLSGSIMSTARGYNSRLRLEIDLADPAFPHVVGSGPALETRQYMKRRARRLLRTLAQTQPDRYVALLNEVLRARGVQAINPTLNWALMDAFYYNSARWSQPKAGRGAYVLDTNKVVIKRREERAPEVWDTRLEAVRALFGAQDVPDEANAMALKVLRARHEALPELAPPLALKFLRSSQPLLQSLGVRALSDQLAGLWGTDAALLIVAANGRLRTRLREPLEQVLQLRDTDWRNAFVESLLQQLEGIGDKARGRAAALLVFELFRDRLPQSALWTRLGVWLSLGGAAREWALSGVRAAGTKGELDHVTDIARLPEAMREDALTAFTQGIAQFAPDANAAYQLVSANDNPAALAIKWQVLAATGVQPETLRALWLKLTAQPAWRTNVSVRHAAVASPYSAELFARIEFGASWPKVLQWLSDTQTVGSFSSAFLDAVIARVTPETRGAQLFDFLRVLSPAVRQHVLDTYQEEASVFAPDFNTLRYRLIPYGYNLEGVTDALWQFIALSNPLPETVREAWPHIGTLYFGAAAGTLFRKGQFSPDEVDAWLPTIKASLAQFGPEYFVAVFEAASDATKVELALDATPPQWDAARAHLLEALNDVALHGAFWRGLWPRLGGPINPELRARLLDDPQIGGSFERLDAAAFTDLVATASDAHESFVTRWLDAHASTLNLDDMEHRELLVALAASELPNVRQRGLELIRSLGIDVSLALRLMEGGLPDGFAAARAWFESRPPSYAFDDALVLCDSPAKSVRAYGLSYVEARRATLLTPQLLTRLMEHPSPEVQGWVAREITQAESNGVQLASREFDATVLKGRGRARTAKETVKRRLTGEAAPSRDTVDEAALLQLARGGIRRDREWALAQLARLSVRGEAVSGVSAQLLDDPTREPAAQERL